MWCRVVWCSGIRRGTRQMSVGGRWWMQRRGVLAELCPGRENRGKFTEGKVFWTTWWVNGLWMRWTLQTFLVCLSRAAQNLKLPGSTDFRTPDFLRKCVILILNSYRYYNIGSTNQEQGCSACPDARIHGVCKDCSCIVQKFKTYHEYPSTI